MSPFSLVVLAIQAVSGSDDELGIDPVTLLQWRAACCLVAEHEAEIWPGYRLGEIPALILHPKKVEVLLRVPKAPPGFVPFAGKNPLGDEPLFVRRGATIFEVGMDTTADLQGVRTLVVTDRGARDGIDDAWNLAVQVHEGFHAWADRHLRYPESNELDLADYPDLDAVRNAHLELEGRELVAAVLATEQDEIEEHAVAFLAERARRRADLPARVLRWEETNELNEGLATYVEWRALELWLAHDVAPDDGPADEFEVVLAACPALKFPTDFAKAIEQKTIQLGHLARGTMSINGSPYGPAAVRRRGYFFGAAQGKLLDRLAHGWKEEVAQGQTLTELLGRALGSPSDEELAERADALEADAKFTELVEKKKGQSALATAERNQRINAVLDGPGTLVVFDVSALVTSGALTPSSYTPFGILRVDDHRRLYAQSPTSFTFEGVTLKTTSGEVAIIADAEKHELLLRSPTAAAALLVKLNGSAAEKAAGAADAVEDAAFELTGTRSHVGSLGPAGSIRVVIGRSGN